MCGCPETVQLVNRFREYLISGMCYACQVSSSGRHDPPDLSSYHKYMNPPNQLQVYYIERQMGDQEPHSPVAPGRSEGEYFLGKFFRLLSRPSPSSYFGPTAKKLEDLGVNCERYEQFCSRVTACFSTEKTKRQTVKAVRNFVRNDSGIDVTKAQFDTCLEMMKEAEIVKQVGNNLLLIKKSHDMEP